MAAPAILLTVLKRRTRARWVTGIAGTLVPVMIMILCSGLVVVALSGQVTAACLTYAASSSNTEPNTRPGTGLSILNVQGPPTKLTAAQVAVARSYIDVGISRNVPDSGLQIALMMSLQESGLRVLANASVPGSTAYPHEGIGADHDSVGTAQQRPSAGWGSVTELMDPVYDAEAFYGGPDGPNHGSPAGLLDISGWEAMAKGDAVQAVQRAAYPELYAKWEGEATAIVAALKSASSPPTCPSDKPAAGMPSLLADLPQERKDIIHYAEEGLGGAYIWGGTAFKAWDCSGYVQWVYQQAGIQLPRTEQWRAGTPTTTPQPGDLVVQNPDGPNHWGHVGIYVGNGMMFSALNPSVGTLLHPVSWNRGTKYFLVA